MISTVAPDDARYAVVYRHTSSGSQRLSDRARGAGRTLAEVVQQVCKGRPELARVLGICVFLVDNIQAESPARHSPTVVSSTPSHPSPAADQLRQEMPRAR
jgi:hypothetical protein